MKFCRSDRTFYLVQPLLERPLDHSAGNAGPNIGKPLTDVSRVASSSMTSQCSVKRPFSKRTISTTIQFAGRPRPVMRLVQHQQIPFDQDCSVLISHRLG